LHDTCTPESIEHQVLEIFDTSEVTHARGKHAALEVYTQGSVIARIRRLIYDIRFQLFVHLLQTSTVGISSFDKIFSCVQNVAAFYVINVSLFCKPPEKDFADSRSEHERLRVVGLGDLGDVLSKLLGQITIF